MDVALVNSTFIEAKLEGFREMITADSENYVRQTLHGDFCCQRSMTYNLQDIDLYMELLSYYKDKPSTEYCKEFTSILEQI